MGTLRKLKRSSRESRKGFEYIPWDVSPPVRPMSEVLPEFAELALGDMDDDYLKTGIAIAALAWNMALVPLEEQNKAFDSLYEDGAIGGALTKRDIRELFQGLIDRKRQAYGDDKRLIVNYTFVEEEGHLRLLVASTPLQLEI